MSADLQAIKTATSLPTLIAETVRLRRAGKLWAGCCPFHGERTPSFYVYASHFHCYACGARGDAFDWLQRQRGMTMSEAVLHLGGTPQVGTRRQPPPPPPPSPARDDAEVVRSRNLARRLWAEGAPTAGTPVESYLASRGLALPQDAPIRFHPQCPRGAERLPAMVSLMTDPASNAPAGIHRTYLRSDGRGKVETGPAKMMLGSGGVVRLDRDDVLTTGLCVGEGIETCLAAREHFGWSPMWATLSTSGLRKLPPLPGVEVLNVFADCDGNDAGLSAARECASAWAAAGVEVNIHLPPDRGTDWLDAANRMRPRS